jgi:hypothetical protein
MVSEWMFELAAKLVNHCSSADRKLSVCYMMQLFIALVALNDSFQCEVVLSTNNLAVNIRYCREVWQTASEVNVC